MDVKLALEWRFQEPWDVKLELKRRCRGHMDVKLALGGRWDRFEVGSGVGFGDFKSFRFLPSPDNAS